MSIDPYLLECINRPIIVASHQRSGTHLTIDLLRRHFPATNPKLRPLESLHHLYVDMDSFNPGHHNPMSTKTALRLLTRNPRPIVKTHTLPNEALCKPEFRPIVHRIYERAHTISVVRDGRNVMLSLHRFERPWNPRARVPLSDFIRSTTDGLCRPAYWSNHVKTWQSVHDCKTLIFRDIISKPREILVELGRFLGMEPVFKEPLLPKPMKSRYDGWLRRLAGNTHTTTIPGEKPMEGEPTKWRDAFSREDREFFDRHAGDTLIDLGYEKDRAWVKAP